MEQMKAMSSVGEALEEVQEKLQSWEEGTHPAVVTLQAEHNKALHQLKETQNRAQRYADKIDSIEEAGEVLAGECANIDASLGERAEAVQAWNAARAALTSGEEKDVRNTIGRRLKKKLERGERI